MASGFANYLISEAGSTAWLTGSDIGKAGKRAEARVRSEWGRVNYTFLVQVWKRGKRRCEVQGARCKAESKVASRKAESKVGSGNS